MSEPEALCCITRLMSHACSSARRMLTRSMHWQGWIDEMATHLKEQDPNHLVTVGEEGFWAVGSAYEASNPGNGWAAITGQNFTANHASKAIDFAGIHVWPDNWEVSNPGCWDIPGIWLVAFQAWQAGMGWA